MSESPAALQSPAASRSANPTHGITFAEAVRVWARVALLSFGGPAGQIAVMHRILVEEKRWIGESRFLHALNYCMLLPGPEAQQLATYVGWLLHRTRGGLVAGCLFVLPGLLAIMALSLVYVALGDVRPVEGLFFGLKAAVLAVVIDAVVRLSRRALKNRTMVGLAVAAFVAIFFFDVAFPAIILAAGAIGFVGGKAGYPAFRLGGPHGSADGSSLGEAPSALGEGVPDHARPGMRWSLAIAATFLVLWLAPIGLLLLTLGPGSAFTAIAIFFAKLAVVTFGGAYAVLAYVAQAAVQTYHWLQPGEMLDGLGLAETTPGPLIMVTQFVGFMAAFRAPGRLDPYVAAVLGGLLTTWVTFVPCFLWIFLGAPYIEALRGNQALSAALAAVTAAVVGVISNLAIWFGLHALFHDVHAVSWLGTLTVDVPRLASINPASLALTVAAMAAILQFRVGVIPVLVACSAAGVLLYELAGASGSVVATSIIG